MAKYNIESIHNILENIQLDLAGELARLEGESPDHMNFEGVNDASAELKEQCAILRKWIDGFKIEDVTVTHY